MAHRSILLTLLSATASTAYHCVEFDVHLSFRTTVLEPTFPPFETQLDAVQFLQNTTRRTMDFVPYSNPTNITLDANIATKYCTPDSGHSNGVVQIMTHGGGFDHRYWEFGGPSSEYNQVKAATEAGYSVLLYDRLGAGNSTKADPYKVVQLPVQAEILAKLTQLLKDSALAPAHHHLPTPKKVVHIGHSIGSGITSGFIARYPQLSDCTILTGFSSNGSWSSRFPIATNFRIASIQNPDSWGDLSTGYWTWIDEVTNQYLFFWWPYFTRAALRAAEENKVPAAVGEIATIIPESPAGYQGSLLIISGAQDQILCGGDCYGILEQAKDVYTDSRPFHTYVQPNTGHGMTGHKNATGGYKVINDFIASSLAV